MMGYLPRHLEDGTLQYYRTTKLPVAVSDEEYAQICELLAKKAQLDEEANTGAQPEDSDPPFQIEMSSGSNNSGYAFFFKIIAWVLWIGGAILALTTSSVQVGYGDTRFRFSLFLPTALTYLLYGGAAMCAAELLENIAAIRTALQSIRFKRK